LELEPSCLAFHKTKRPDRTASYEQVRQPIYQKSLAQWQHFEPFLGELKKLFMTKKLVLIVIA
jgi:hypothetical protein